MLLKLQSVHAYTSLSVFVFVDTHFRRDCIGAASPTTTVSGAGFFRILELNPRETKMIRFAVITDVQYGNLDDLGARTYRESISKFLRAAGEIATEEVLFTLQLGDASQSDWGNHLAIKELFDNKIKKS